jgi:hypothetical protein
MNARPYFIVLSVSIACVGLSIALIAVSNANRDLQLQLQLQQQTLNSGLMGQQGQQVAAGLMQDLTAAAGRNPGVRALLERLGYATPPPTPPSAAESASATPKGESAKPEGADKEPMGDSEATSGGSQP